MNSREFKKESDVLADMAKELYEKSGKKCTVILLTSFEDDEAEAGAKVIAGNAYDITKTVADAISDSPIVETAFVAGLKFGQLKRKLTDLKPKSVTEQLHDLISSRTKKNSILFTEQDFPFFSGFGQMRANPFKD